MPKAVSIACPSCGARNPSPLPRGRCTACGVRIEVVGGSPHRRKDPLRQAGFSWGWFAIALVIVGVVTVALVFGVPLVVPLFDFEGSAGAMVALVAYFVGGLLVGLVSPGRTFAEPAVATALVAGPVAFFLHQGQTVKVWPAFLYVLMGALGVVFALIGAYYGERAQVGAAEPVRD